MFVCVWFKCDTDRPTVGWLLLTPAQEASEGLAASPMRLEASQMRSQRLGHQETCSESRSFWLGERKREHRPAGCQCRACTPVKEHKAQAQTQRLGPDSAGGPLQSSPSSTWWPPLLASWPCPSQSLPQKARHVRPSILYSQHPEPSSPGSHLFKPCLCAPR